MRVEVLYRPQLAEYRLSDDHPLRPERFTLAVALAEEWGLLGGTGGATVVAPEAASVSELEMAHDPTYVTAVVQASGDPERWTGGAGIGTGDTPAFARMHEAAALVAGATTQGLHDVVAGSCERAFSPAGGLHHAHRDRAAGFCVYNDLAVAIAATIAENPGLRVAYVDVDAHHGDGVQEAFYARDDVLTVSLHESGRYLYPGTGFISETGEGPGLGYALNVPLPPSAGDACYERSLELVVAPALLAFAPDVMVVQLGADSHRDDPLTHLDTTVAGQYASARRLVSLAEQVCGGRIVATGGGGYDTFSAVPRAWACAIAALLGIEPPVTVPESWRRAAYAASGDWVQVAPGTFSEPTPAPDELTAAAILAETEQVLQRLLQTHPLLQRQPLRGLSSWR